MRDKVPRWSIGLEAERDTEPVWTIWLRKCPYPWGIKTQPVRRPSLSKLKMTVFWDIAPCSFVEVGRRFRGAYCFNRRPDCGGSKDLWNVGKLYENTWWYIPNDSHLHTRRCENLKSHSGEKYSCPDDGGSRHLWNADQLLQHYTAQYPRRMPFSCLPPQESEISLMNNVKVTFALMIGQ
jgi:hypothetical protein